MGDNYNPNDTSSRYDNGYSYQPPTVVLNPNQVSGSGQRNEKERVVNVYLGIESQAYFEKYHVYLSGKAKRQVRRKLERLYDQGKLKLANLN